jgi:hypothetical protein
VLPDIYLGWNILVTNEKVCNADFQQYMSTILYGLLRERIEGKEENGKGEKREKSTDGKKECNWEMCTLQQVLCTYTACIS